MANIALAGLPALFGVFIGVAIYAWGWWWFIGTAVLLVVLTWAAEAGERSLWKCPRLSRWAIEFSILIATLIIAVATYLVCLASISSGELLRKHLLPESANPEELKQISNLLIGALTAYLGLVWTKDIGDAKGPNWPNIRFKKAMDNAYEAAKEDHKTPKDGPGARSLFYDDTFSYKIGNDEKLEIDGWGFDARRKRMRGLKYFRTHREEWAESEPVDARELETTFRNGFKELRAVLGAKHVDGPIDGTDRLLNLAMLTALHRPDELRLYVKDALDGGITAGEIKEVMTHAAVYCGPPVGPDGFNVAHEVLVEAGLRPANAAG